jgi:hypothetical protein
MHNLARELQGAAVAEHVARGGAMASAWLGVAIGVAVVICVVVPAIALLPPGR